MNESITFWLLSCKTENGALEPLYYINKDRNSLLKKLLKIPANKYYKKYSLEEENLSMEDIFDILDPTTDKTFYGSYMGSLLNFLSKKYHLPENCITKIQMFEFLKMDDFRRTVFRSRYLKTNLKTNLKRNE